MPLQALVSFCDAPRLSRDIADAAQNSFNQTVSSLQQRLNLQLKQFQHVISEQFEQNVTPQLQSGAASSSADATRTCQQWGISVSSGGLHWATYKACVRRQGEWRIDMNQQLADPVFKAVSTGWERVFVAKLSTELVTLRAQLTGVFLSVIQECHEKMAEAGVPQDRLSGVCSIVESTLKAKLIETCDKLKEDVSNQQKELSRSIVPLVKACMTPAYELGVAEAGTGEPRNLYNKLSCMWIE